MARSSGNDDPRRLRELFSKAAGLACEHALTSVVVGMAGREGDLLFPEVVNLVESELRVDDSIFRMTRERAVLLLADVDRARAEEIVRRILRDFGARYPTAQELEISLVYVEITPDSKNVTVKGVLPTLFPVAPAAH